MARTQEFIPVVGEQDVDDLLPVGSSDVYLFLPLFSFPLLLFFWEEGRKEVARWGEGIGGFFFGCLSLGRILVLVMHLDSWLLV